jgi:hypothetical protein
MNWFKKLKWYYKVPLILVTGFLLYKTVQGIVLIWTIIQFNRTF